MGVKSCPFAVMTRIRLVVVDIFFLLLRNLGEVVEVVVSLQHSE